MSKSKILWLVLLICALLGGYWVWQGQRSVLPAADTQAVVSAPAPVPAPAASAPAEPAIQYPVAPDAETGAPLPALAESDAWLKAPLEELLGRKNVLRFLQLDSLVRRIVVTVDNLAREHAPPMVWPVVPTPGRFATLARGGANAGEVIHPDNARRYTPLVQFIEGIDSAKAVALYVRLYPLFQQAYEEAGFPRRYFNDRLVAVIDLLLATPVPEEPVGVALVKVKGPVAPERPWVRYEYTNAELEALAAGQKMLIRTGPVNQRRLQAKLRELRPLLAGAGKAAAAATAASAPRAN